MMKDSKPHSMLSVRTNIPNVREDEGTLGKEHPVVDVIFHKPVGETYTDTRSDSNPGTTFATNV